MYCRCCGKQIPDNSGFCSYCGEQVKKDLYNNESDRNGALGNDIKNRIKNHGLLGKMIPLKIFGKILVIPLWIAGCSASVFLIITVISIHHFSNRYDLEGSYYTDEFFPISSITFYDDGTFTTYSDLETLQGRYSKNGDVYSLRFTGGDADSGNSVVRFLADSADAFYELEATKMDDGTMEFTVIPKVSYYAWLGKYVTFYPQ